MVVAVAAVLFLPLVRVQVWVQVWVWAEEKPPTAAVTTARESLVCAPVRPRPPRPPTHLHLHLRRVTPLRRRF